MSGSGIGRSQQTAAEHYSRGTRTWPTEERLGRDASGNGRCACLRRELVQISEEHLDCRIPGTLLSNIG